MTTLTATTNGFAAKSRKSLYAAPPRPTAATRSSRNTTNQAMKMLLSSRITNTK